MSVLHPTTWDEFLDQLDAGLDRVELAVNSALDQPRDDAGTEGAMVSEHVARVLSDDSLGIGSMTRLGQMPERVADRAQKLFDRQALLIDRVKAVQTDIRGHLSVVDSSIVRSSDVPAYLDVSG